MCVCVCVCVCERESMMHLQGRKTFSLEIRMTIISVKYQFIMCIASRTLSVLLRIVKYLTLARYLGYCFITISIPIPSSSSVLVVIINKNY